MGRAVRPESGGIDAQFLRQVRLSGAVLCEQNGEWQTASLYMQLEAFAQIGNEETAPHLKHKNESRMIMTSDHPGIYTTMTNMANHRQLIHPVHPHVANGPQRKASRLVRTTTGPARRAT